MYTHSILFQVGKHEGFGKPATIHRGSTDMVNDPQGLRRIPSFPQLAAGQHQLRGNGSWGGGAFVSTSERIISFFFPPNKKL